MPANFTQVDVKDLYSAIQKSEDFLLLDVRTIQEYKNASIKGSINIPLDEIEKKMESTNTNKNKKIYVYCLSGSRSILAADILSKLGYTNVSDVKNGLLAWRVNNFPI
jgi:rhodanese-related sulfurtransferase